MTDRPKATSFHYGRDYQLFQAEKFRERYNNHWKLRYDLAQGLLERYALPRLAGKPKDQIVVVDIGCSIGTFAIEYAKLGYRSFGIDFDPNALEVARELAKEEKVAPEFVCGDIADWDYRLPKIDIAFCMDIFEHLHDDELGSFLTAVRKQLSPAGSLVFHTYPTQYNHVVYGRPAVRLALRPFRYLPSSGFNRVLKACASLLDIGHLIRQGMTYRELIKQTGHCNPTTAERLADILKRSYFEVKNLESSNLYPFKGSISALFSRQPLTHRNLYGVAVPQPDQPGC